MTRRLTLTLGFLLLALLGLFWLVQTIGGPAVPAQYLTADPRTPGEHDVRLELMTPAGPLPVHITRYFIVDRDDVERRQDFRTAPLGEWTAFWRYYLRVPSSVAQDDFLTLPSRTEPIPERPGWARLVLTMDGMGAELVAEYTGHELQPVATVLANGVLRHTRNDDRPAVPFRGTPANAQTPLMAPADRSKTAAPFAGRWRLQLDGIPEPLTGSIRVGEYTGQALATFAGPRGEEQLLGRVDGNRLRVAVFDGTRAALCTATMRDDGTLAGDWWDSQRGLLTWTAVRED